MCAGHMRPKKLTSCYRRFDGVMPLGYSMNEPSFTRCTLASTLSLSLADVESANSNGGWRLRSVRQALKSTAPQRRGWRIDTWPT